jgi:hypothetical protein
MAAAKKETIEALKLRAAFYNNLAVGLTVAGLLVPFLTLYVRAGEFESAISSWWNGAAPFNDFAVKRLIGEFCAMFAALYGARRLRSWAHEVAMKITDAKAKHNG